MEPENDNESNNFSEDSCGGITMILIGIVRLSMEKNHWRHEIIWSKSAQPTKKKRWMRERSDQEWYIYDS